LNPFIGPEMPILNEYTFSEKTEFYRKEFKNLCIDFDILNLF
jgi:hypothetical protein